jgi:hypothetical protein
LHDPPPLDVGSIVLNDLESLHFQLEVIEHRIQSGEDQSHDHPALSVTLLSTSDFSNLSYRETVFKTHYRQESRAEQIPGFWVGRPWDSPHRRMTGGETAALQTAIEKLHTDGITVKRSKSKRARMTYVEE